MRLKCRKAVTGERRELLQSQTSRYRNKGEWRHLGIRGCPWWTGWPETVQAGKFSVNIRLKLATNASMGWKTLTLERGPQEHDVDTEEHAWKMQRMRGKRNWRLKIVNVNKSPPQIRQYEYCRRWKRQTTVITVTANCRCHKKTSYMSNYAFFTL